ncbi:uncharacterized protein HD556DRAFT_1437886 [Suillus plorans]|uniref:Uncharacterized protein n=1 Tax=Suillus plorans TaxID=116603 RepID=A0A9P7J4T7_9AGAM|nr:uncharacterized protein HD556DRAFT_1437886 [Suillus plorans]KAG1802819.1 hypothetical protein HD556DRAFT_1437886 [Suillus plorans]
MPASRKQQHTFSEATGLNPYPRSLTLTAGLNRPQISLNPFPGFLNLPGPSSVQARTTVSSIGPFTVLPDPDPILVDQDEEIPDTPETQPRYRARYEAPPPDPEEEPSDKEDSDDDMPKHVEKKIGTPPDFNGERDTSSRFI